MIKVDLHLHTVPSSLKSESFDFSLDILEKYVVERELDVIAITNHNLFDKDNFDLIKNHLSISVFPGVEVDLETGHILVITDISNIDNFCNKCLEVSSIASTKGKLTFDEFSSIFRDKNEYLFIPHFSKKPRITGDVIKKFGKDIFCGEVSNQNKFIRLYKEENGLVPVLFSDSRFFEGSNLPMRFTYLDTNLTDFKSIKETLKDKEKVFLNCKKGHSTFQVLQDGTEASTGLNIILGKRSSGKTHTLESIFKNFSNNQRIKYIKQFELIEKNSDEKEEQMFNEQLGEKSSLFTEEYLRSFKDAVDHVQTINLSDEKTKAGDYIEHLLEFASESDKHDTFAKIPVFSEQNFSISNTKNISDLIAAVLVLIKNNEYKTLVEKHISTENLLGLYRDLVQIYKKESLHIRATEITNKLMDSLKIVLTVESNYESIPNFDIIKYSKNIYEISLFEKLVNLFDINEEIKSIQLGKFVVAAKRVKITSAQDLQRIFKTKASFSQFVSLREKPYEYLIALKSSNVVPPDVLYKAFAKVEFYVLNSEGLKVSGGERAEFNLEERLFDASNYEMLLIDEPESSFDNLFLKESIFKRIKTLSKDMPVFVSTHNNVIGASFKPNFILFTEKTIENSNPVFRVYCGEPTNKQLFCCDGKTTSNKIVQLNCLEGGEDAYIERKNTYENIEN